MAVYTEVSDVALKGFLTNYDIGTLRSFNGITEGVENTNYLVHTDIHSYILTLYERRVDKNDLPFFLKLLEHLAAHSISCPTPIKSKNGQMLGELSGKPATIVSYLEGSWVRRPSPHHCHEVGAALAQLHLAGSDFKMTRANALGPASWTELGRDTANHADTVTPGLRTEIAADLDNLVRAWPIDLPAGIIHADLFPDNVFFIDDQLSGLIDFYFACHDAFAYDISICLNAWCFEPDNAFNITKARQLLRAYENIRPLSRAEYDAIPLLSHGAAMRFLLTRLYDWINTTPNALVKPKDPAEYIRKLRFHRSVTSPTEYGLDER